MFTHSVMCEQTTSRMYGVHIWCTVCIYMQLLVCGIYRALHQVYNVLLICIVHEACDIRQPAHAQLHLLLLIFTPIPSLILCVYNMLLYPPLSSSSDNFLLLCRFFVRETVHNYIFMSYVEISYSVVVIPSLISLLLLSPRRQHDIVVIIPVISVINCLFYGNSSLLWFNIRKKINFLFFY